MSGGLSNADFRALLATPRHGAGGGGGSGGGGGEKKKGGGGGGKKPGRGFKPGGRLGEEAEKEEGPKYRDRAAERRKGLSSEFEGVPDDLVGLLEGQAGGGGGLSYEDSKYLGGDVAHTHLVKGLDFALLRKVRAEQEAAKSSGKAGVDSDDEGPVLAKPVVLAGQAQAAPVFRTPMGAAVHAFFFDPAARRGPGVPVHELFLPRRTAFVYELDGDELAACPDVPTTLRRAAEDCPRPPDSALGALDAPLLERIAKIMSYMAAAGGGRKKLKKKEREALLAQHGIALAGAVRAGAPGDAGDDAPGDEAAAQGRAAPPPPRPADEDDDIFGDAGTDYAPTIKDKERAAKAAAAASGDGDAGGARRGGYFGASGEDLHADLPPLPRDDDGAPPPPPEDLGPEMGPAAGAARPPAGYDAGAAYGAYPQADAFSAEATAEAMQEQAAAAARQERERQKRRAAELLSGGDDAYAECYPSYYDAGTMVEDSDDEGGGPANQQQALTRRDFASEADWEEYQASGMAPRQAEGRAKVRAQQKEASKEKSKMATQLGKIQKILEDKGYDHGAAFARAPRRSEQGEGGEGTGAGAGGAAFTKKRRI